MQSTAQSLGHQLLSLVAAGVTDVGPKSHNEDCLLIQETSDGGQVLMVFDGMGGMGRGDEASQAALRVVAERLIDNTEPAFDAVLSGIRRADLHLREMIEKDGSGKKPGTTAAIVYIQHGRVTIGWVGDSTVMIVRKGRVHTQNRSHRVVQKLIDQGLMTEESAKNSPMGRLLERSLGGRDDGSEVKPGLLERWNLVEGDYLVLCSDGLTDSIPAAEIPSFLRGNDVRSLAGQLLDEAKRRGIDDNTTIIVARAVRWERDLPDVVGGSWTMANAAEISLPPVDYRSGIVNRDVVAMIDKEREGESSSAASELSGWVPLMLAVAVAFLLLAIVLAAFALFLLI